MFGHADIPVCKGAAKPMEREVLAGQDYHGGDGLGGIHLDPPEKQPEAETAVEFLVRKARELKGELILVPIGPLTNIAEAIKADPEFVNNVKEIIMMGGAEWGGNVTPSAEFNFWEDPEAAKLVFQAGFKKVTMVGLDGTRCIYLTPLLRELLYLIDTPVSRFIHKTTRFYADGHWKIAKQIGCELCDVLAVGYLLDPSVATVVDAYVDIETQGLCRGESVVYRTMFFPDKQKNCQVVTKADPKKFFEVFFGRMFPEYLDIVKENM
jgi:purine nucleosidase